MGKGIWRCHGLRMLSSLWSLWTKWQRMDCQWKKMRGRLFGSCKAGNLLAHFACVKALYIDHCCIESCLSKILNFPPNHVPAARSLVLLSQQGHPSKALRVTYTHSVWETVWWPRPWSEVVCPCLAPDMHSMKMRWWKGIVAWSAGSHNFESGMVTCLIRSLHNSI